MKKPTLAELRAAREKAGQDVIRLRDESNAEGFTSSPEWDEKWTAANESYNAAVAAEEAEIARRDRDAAADRVRQDATRIETAQRGRFRPDANPNADPRSAGQPNRVPAQFRRHGPLRAFRGPDAAERAHRVGMWALATIYGMTSARQWCEQNGVLILQDESGPRATINTADNASAGYLVPDELDLTILELAEQFGVFRQFAEVVPMASGTKKSPRWTRSMTAYYIGEGNKPTQSDPAWDLITLTAKDLGAMTKMTRQIDEDTPVDLGDKIAVALAEAFSYAEDNAGFNGDGGSAYGGITGLVAKIGAAAAAFKQAAAGNDSPSNLDVDDFNAVVAAFPNYPMAKPRWFMHKAVWANACQRLQLAAGGLTPTDLAQGGEVSFLGYPVTWVNVLEDSPAAATIPILFGDLMLSSKLGTRRGRTVEAGFENDDFTKQLITVLGTQRFDVNNHTITSPRDATKAGPVMGLKLAA